MNSIKNYLELFAVVFFTTLLIVGICLYYICINAGKLEIDPSNSTHWYHNEDCNGNPDWSVLGLVLIYIGILPDILFLVFICFIAPICNFISWVYDN
jgi:hypothetical protein